MMDAVAPAEDSFPRGTSDERELYLRWLRYLRGTVTRKLARLCFLALGVGALALSAAMALDRPGASMGRLVLVLLGAFGLGTLVCAACPTDLNVPHAAHTVAGRIHDGAATGALLCGLVAMPVAAWGWRSEARWRELSGPSVGRALLWQVGVAHRLRDTVARS